MSDRTTEPTLRELLDAHSEAWFSQYHAPILGRVQTYDPATQLADVEPLVILRVEGLDTVKSPILRGVPVAFPGGSLTSYTWPLHPGDPLELVPQDADFGAYWASGTVGQLPNSKRRMSLSDCVAIPVRSLSQAGPPTSTAWALDGGVLWGLHYAGGSDATDFAAMAAKVLAELNSIKSAFSAHVHTGVEPGAGSTNPGPTYSPSSVACTLLKVK
jgi:hypothetical protein